MTGTARCTEYNSIGRYFSHIKRHKSSFWTSWIPTPLQQQPSPFFLTRCLNIKLGAHSLSPNEVAFETPSCRVKAVYVVGNHGKLTCDETAISTDASENLWLDLCFKLNSHTMISPSVWDTATTFWGWTSRIKPTCGCQTGLPLQSQPGCDHDIHLPHNLDVAVAS